MKKTLVIHPSDKSTDFLKPIYSEIPNCTVISGGISKSEVEKEIGKHDRIIMLGHGTVYGLLSINLFGNVGHVIDRESVKYLKNKECIFIWCNANIFVEYYRLKGLYSGMFVSEVDESVVCGCESTQNEVDNSNDFFSITLGEHINEELDVMYENLKEKYGQIRLKNKVAFFNHQRLYLNI